MYMLPLGVPDRPGIVEDLLFLPILGDGDGGRGRRVFGVQEVLHLCPLDLG